MLSKVVKPYSFAIARGAADHLCVARSTYATKALEDFSSGVLLVEALVPSA